MMVRLIPLLALLAFFSGCGNAIMQASSGGTPTTGGGTVVTPPVDPPPVDPPLPKLDFVLLEMHGGAIRNTPFQPYEVADRTFSVTAPSPAGSSSIAVADTSGAVPGQLLVYRGDDGIYRTGVVTDAAGGEIYLRNPVEDRISAGTAVRSFYHNDSHPTMEGYRAIADSIAPTVGRLDVQGKKLVLFGDSWMQTVYIGWRLAEWFPELAIVNKGKGGNTAADLLARFDTDVAPLQPDYVMILTGTNDYFRRVSRRTYIGEIRELIGKVEALGAVPLVFDSSVGPVLRTGYAQNELKLLSDEYAAGLAEAHK